MENVDFKDKTVLVIHVTYDEANNVITECDQSNQLKITSYNTSVNAENSLYSASINTVHIEGVTR